MTNNNEPALNNIHKIELKNVRFCYPDKSGCFCALEDYNLTIDEGEFVCILGKSGCGKTTLLRLIAGFSSQSQGEVIIDGHSQNKPGPDKAFVFQDYSLFPWLTVRGNVAFAIRQVKKISKKEADKIADSYLEKVDMLEAADKYPRELSGGMKQRIAIARALAMDSDIILMDEPFGALDTKNRSDLQNLVEELWLNSNKKKTIVFVTHDVREAVRLASKIVYMEKGQVKKVLNVNIERPRKKLTGGELIKQNRLKYYLTGLYYDEKEEDEEVK